MFVILIKCYLLRPIYAPISYDEHTFALMDLPFDRWPHQAILFALVQFLSFGSPQGLRRDRTPAATPQQTKTLYTASTKCAAF